jgi:glucan-binding YG repeat protein
VYDNDLIYVRTNGQLATGRYWITKTNDLMPEQAYQFDEYGRMVLDSGFKTVDGVKYYYKNGMPFYAGLIEAEGAYYYAKTSGEVITNRNYWITKTNGLVPEASYAFDADGKMLNAPGKSDVAEDFTGIKDGYYYKNGAITYAGLIEIDGNYYYVRTNGQVATGRYWITKTNNLMKAGSYQFDDNGVMLNPAK